jgi:two-component system chemotaxis sensor kinase CheA
MKKENSEIVKEFLLESFEALGSISDELTSYEKNPKDKELLNSIFRKVHTLKGSAGFLGLKKLQEITHSAESVLDLIREDKINLNSDMVDAFLISFDCCLEQLKNIEETGAEVEKDYGHVIKMFSSVLEKNVDSFVLVEDGEKIHKELMDQVSHEKDSYEVTNKDKEKVEPSIIANPPSVEVKKTIVNPVVIEKESVNEQVIIDNEKGADNNSSSLSVLTDSVVRVNVQLLDKIMNIVGELVLNRNQILQYANVMDSSELNRLSQQLNIITTELQTDIMKTRMQPVGSVLTKFERIVRDLARSQNKKIKLEIIGKDTELDKTLLEAIRDPITHLIRNSVDHGVELPEARRLKGKNEEGKIIIKSFHEGGQVTIEIKDDGNGIDPQRILEKAIQKGVVSAEQGSKMSTRQILNIIFMPGFSTAEQVTNISGRGVGMDVVKSNIEKNGGTVDVISIVGEGTTFKLKIPLTLAIVPALVIQDKNETFAIPQINLVELVRLEGEASSEQVEFLHDSEFFRLRGNLIPLFRLSDCLNSHKKIVKKVLDSSDSLANDKVTNIVILSAEGRDYGLVVDAILDTEEIVVKPLSKKLKNITLFAGATIMGDGRVALIIDALGFFNAVDRGHEQKSDRIQIDNPESQKFTSEDQEILLCSLGDNRSYAIPLLLVSRLEEFHSENVEWTGNQALMKYGNAPMPLINLEKSLKLTGKSVLDDLKNKNEITIPCIVVKIRDQFVGLVVESIKDIAMSEGGINSESIDRQGLLGTVFTSQKTISILDVHDIVEMQKIGKKSQIKQAIVQTGKILVIEDSPLYRRVMGDLFEESGFEVVFAFNGKEGLDFLERGDLFDLVVSDIEMPIMDGWDFSSKVRSSKKSFSKIPIVAVSTRISKEDIEKGKAVGFSQHLEKLNKDEVLKAVNSYVNQDR